MGDRPTFSVNAMRYGRDEPLAERIQVRAGPLSAVLENGDLRYVRLDGELVVLRLYGAVRDRNWDTIEPRFLAYDVEERNGGFAVRYTAECVSDDVDFVWQGRLTGTPEGVITAVFEGEARSTFHKNRIGWCVLHPMGLAGLPVETETPDGPVGGSFPVTIAPWQPFFDMRSISHPTASGGQVTIRFEGDLFEMEDQRNWTDASYKTYSTPLRLPYPAEIQEGERVAQTVTIQVTSVAAVTSTVADNATMEVRVGIEPTGALPPIGLGAASHGQGLSDLEAQRIRALRPAHLRASIDLGEGDWEERLRQTAADAEAVGAGLELEIRAGDDGKGLDALARTLGRLETRVARILVFPRSEHVTTERVMARAREELRGVAAGAHLGGGSRAYFTELNRATLPLELMEVVGYTINPQVHAFDNASLVETLAAEGATVRSAKAIVGDRPLAVGPVTLRPRFNPNATGPEPRTAPWALPSSVDSRQPSLFGAGWTLGSIKHLGIAGVDSLTYYETTGWRGVMERCDHALRVEAFRSSPGMLFPLYHVLADVGEYAGGGLLPVEVSDPLEVEALALRSGSKIRVLVASFDNEPRQVRLALSGLTEAIVRVLDETTFDQATTEPDGCRKGAISVATRGGSISLALRPFAVATIDAFGNW